MKNRIVISLRISDKMSGYIYFLKSNRINTASIIRSASEEALKIKCDEFKMKSKNEKTPF